MAKDRYKIQPNCYIWGVSPDVPMIAFPQPIFQIPSYKPIRKLYSGSGVSFLIDEEYRLMSWGQSQNGMLGQDLTIQCSEPVAILPDVRIIKVAIGNQHVIALTSDGKVMTWGHNAKKQLGRPSEGPVARVPGFVEALSKYTISTITAFGDSSYAISNKGEMFSWGSNMNMELGHSSTSYSVLEPTLVTTITNPVKKIVKSGGFFIAVCRNPLSTSSERDSELSITPSKTLVPMAPPPPNPDLLLEDYQRQNEELKQELERLKTSHPKGSPSSVHSRRPSESAVSFQAGGDEGKVQFSQLSSEVGQLIARLKTFYDILFNIDQTMIFAFQSRGGGSVSGVINMIHMAGEALENFSERELAALTSNESLDQNLREQLVVIQKIGLDAINLRKINFVCGKMFLRCVKLKSNSYEEVRKFLKERSPNMPQKNILEEFQTFCLKATAKIKDDTIEVESLQQGVNDLTSYA